MNIYEMEGFLRGKCLPRDILVNESTASYLIRKFNESATLKADRDAQQKRADALAVENGVIKLAFKNLSNTVEEAELYGDMKYLAEPSEYEALADAIEGTPATSAALAAIEARVVEKFIVWSTASSGFDYDITIEDAQKFATELREAK